jgi:hypothetical protein
MADDVATGPGKVPARVIGFAGSAPIGGANRVQAARTSASDRPRWRVASASRMRAEFISRGEAAPALEARSGDLEQLAGERLVLGRDVHALRSG